jgi:hypothetical protein
LLAALNRKVVQDPNFIVPEGYRKVTEKTPIYNYVIPECARIVMEEYNGE